MVEILIIIKRDIWRIWHMNNTFVQGNTIVSQSCPMRRAQRIDGLNNLIRSMVLRKTKTHTKKIMPHSKPAHVERSLIKKTRVWVIVRLD